jgi:DNA-binding transcriptional regulator GbsR (MarR family)
VWTLLVIRSAPMPQTEIAETLGVSKALISSAISELSGYGLVRQVGEHRSAPYEATMDVWPAITDILRTREWMLLESTRMALDSTLEEARLQPDGPYSVERLEMLLAGITAIQGLLKLVISIRRPESARSLTDWIAAVTTLIKNLRELR